MRAHRSTPSPNPPGLCMCGCGQPTPLATYDYPARGVVKGEPLRYIHGHNTRKRQPGYVVDERSGCWLWTGSINATGYGWLTGVLAHRMVYERMVAPLPPGTILHHTCRVHRCVNPAHLIPMTLKEHSTMHEPPRDKTLVCGICGNPYTGSRSSFAAAKKRDINICGSPACKAEIGRRSALKRWRP